MKRTNAVAEVEAVESIVKACGALGSRRQARAIAVAIESLAEINDWKVDVIEGSKGMTLVVEYDE